MKGKRFRTARRPNDSACRVACARSTYIDGVSIARLLCFLLLCLIFFLPSQLTTSYPLSPASTNSLLCSRALPLPPLQTSTETQSHAVFAATSSPWQRPRAPRLSPWPRVMGARIGCCNLQAKRCDERWPELRPAPRKWKRIATIDKNVSTVDIKVSTIVAFCYYWRNFCYIHQGGAEPRDGSDDDLLQP